MIPGYHSIELLKIETDDELEFVTIMTFDSLQNVIDFQGQDYTRCYVPEATQKLLKRWGQDSMHYASIESRKY